MTENRIPNFQDLLWPTLKALESCGGSASIQELAERIVRDLELSDEVLDVMHKGGSLSEVDYRAAWARTYLKYVGAVDNTQKGVWTITGVGRAIRSEEELRELVRQERAHRHKERAKLHKEKQARGAESGVEDDDADDQRWKEDLLGIVRGIAPDAFERLCQLVLRESGFTKVEVMGRPGDGGIDGAGVLRVNNLISFHVRFQCKRYSGSVAAREIRDFRGAMAGRADKGLFITTGSFTKDAAREAVRDGAPAIDLIDGNDLCDLLKRLNLGVTTETVEVVKLHPEFFENL